MAINGTLPSYIVMPVLFDLLAEETEPTVRVVRGHFMFVYIHPQIPF
jgi:Fic family protein